MASLSDLIKVATNNISKTTELTTVTTNVTQTVANTSDASGVTVNNVEQTTNLITNEVHVEEVKIEEVHIENDVTINLMVDPEYIKSIITKIGLDINLETTDKIIKLLKLLSQVDDSTNENVVPLRKIINEINNITSNGKLDILDIPAIIKILVQLFNIHLTKNYLSQIRRDLTSNVTAEDISFLIKIIVNMLVDNKIITVNVDDLASINKVVDYSLNLLQSALNVVNIKKSKWCCCF